MITAPYELVRYNSLVFGCPLDSFFLRGGTIGWWGYELFKSIAAFKTGRGRSWHAEKFEILVSL